SSAPRASWRTLNPPALRSPVREAPERTRAEALRPAPEAGRDGRAWVLLGAPEETIGRISTSCSREQMGQFWTRWLWRQKVGMTPHRAYRARRPGRGATPSPRAAPSADRHALAAAVFAAAGDHLAEAAE